ncbi:MAG: CRISPR-associated protein Csm7, partial [Halothiobacillaceae bacterium]
MLTLKATLAPCSAFGTPIKGDTLFGQLCWALRNRLGEARLVELLDGYTDGRPFAVVSDAMPVGHLPRPTLPGHVFKPLADTDRKAEKKRIWMPVEHLATPIADWLAHCRAAHELPGGEAQSHPHPHNAIDRRTGTTGEGFAPYSLTRHWYSEGARLDLWIVLDEARLSIDELEQALADIGELGFGRDASIGLGRFRVDALTPADLPAQANADAW